MLQKFDLIGSLKASLRGFYRGIYNWLVIENKSKNPSRAMDYMGQLNLSIDAEVTIAVNSKNTFKLYEVYNPGFKQGGKLITQYIGNWSLNQKFR